VAARGDFSDALFLAKEVYVAELAGQVTAWASLIARGETCWLDDLWVKPKSIRTGIGTQLQIPPPRPTSQFGYAGLAFLKEGVRSLALSVQPGSPPSKGRSSTWPPSVIH
jgi:hypothetical protein